MSPCRRPSAFPLLIAAALLVLAPAAGRSQEKAAPPKPAELTARLIGHAHIDLSWLWRWEESVLDVAVQTFKGTLAQMEKMAGLTFAQSQPAVYDAVAKADPALFQAIKDKIKQGTWRPVGGMWAEPDMNMPDGESLARQLLYGKRYFLDQFGVDVTVGWNPDTFGHNWQTPQILAKAGIPYYVFGRCAPENVPAFWWEGKDGTRILCYVPQGWYNVSLRDGIRDTIVKAASQGPLRDFMILYGAGDHGGGPRDTDLEAIKAFGRDPAHPKLEFTTPEAFFKIVEASGAALPVVDRELNFTFPACYTTQTEAKKANRELEGLLAAAEAFSTVAVASGYRDYYPERDLDEAWKIVLRNQFHDILDGSSIGPVYEEALKAYAEARERGRRALDFSLETLAASVDTRGEGQPVLVFNPLLWERTDVVAVPLPDPAAGPVRVFDAKGAEVACQTESSREFPRPSRDQGCLYGRGRALAGLQALSDRKATRRQAVSVRIRPGLGPGERVPQGRPEPEDGLDFQHLRQSRRSRDSARARLPCGRWPMSPKTCRPGSSASRASSGRWARWGAGSRSSSPARPAPSCGSALCSAAQPSSRS